MRSKNIGGWFVYLLVALTYGAVNTSTAVPSQAVCVCVDQIFFHYNVLFD